MPSLVDRIVDESLNTVKRAGRKEYERTRTLILDILSLSASGYILDPKPRELCKTVGDEHGNSTILGKWSKTSPLSASVINAFSAHVLELDDWLAPGLVHAGASIIPTIIAVAEKNGATLEEAMESIMLGYEVAGRVGILLGKKHYRYWHTTSTAGGVGVAAAVSYLLRHEADPISKAVSTAAAYAAGLWGIIGREVSVKPLSTSHAAFVGLVASGLESFVPQWNKNVFESERGVCRVMSGECNIEKALTPPWDIAVNKVSHKLYPASRNAQTVIQVALRASEKVKASEIREIELEVFEEAYQVADIVGPLTVDEAKFSLTFLTSLSLTRGWHSIYDLKRGLRDPLVRELERKVKIRIRPDFTAMYPERQPVLLRIKTKDNNIIEIYEEIPIGDPQHPLTRETIIRKAYTLADEAGDARIKLLANRILEAKFTDAVGDILNAVSEA